MTDNTRAEQWRRQGSAFSWAPADAPAQSVEVFHVEMGAADAPAVLLVHGFPTCSIDWFDMAELLRDRFRVCALDFPGYGFSDKPQGWGYSLARDADLLDHYVRQVVGADTVIVVAHDRGSSVALNYTLAHPEQVNHLVLTNGNIYLPLSNLTDFQRLVLDADTAPAVLEALTPARLAAGMGASTFSPPRRPGHRDVEALTATFTHADGIRVLHETIQYLVERSDHEQEWLRALGDADVSTTVVWGLNDTVSPPRVATHVWSEFLMHKPGRNRFYAVPDANHYLQVDRPDALAAVLLHTLDRGSHPDPGPLAAESASPLLLDTSRPRMPAARDVLKSHR